MQTEYTVQMEIAGPAAIFARPDTGGTPVSYPAPTFSAAKGMFEAIARLRSACIKPTRVEICRPVRYAQYTTNYGGPLRKSNQLAAGASYQLMAVILEDVCYRLYGVVEAVSDSPDGTNSRHALQEIFNRRIERGQSFYTPCLGWKEFTPSYVGPFRPHTNPDATINLEIPSMLYSPFDALSRGRVRPRFVRDVRVEGGVLKYA